MKNFFKLSLSVLLVLCIVLGLLPGVSLRASAASNDVYSVKNDYITLEVSGENGGFTVYTGTGDKLNKADDNKKLLYHRGEFDTSFTSFEVTYNPGAGNEYKRDYVFGGDYGFLSLSSSDVAVVKKSDTEIDATWRVDALTFTQKLTLVSAGANEHGMVSIRYDVQNGGNARVAVKARVLLDTMLGDQDYAYYEVVDRTGVYRSIKSETVLTASDSIPQNFFAYDDPYNPTVTAYTVSAQSQIPYQAAFGHWNSLAATIFDFAPDSTLDFTDPYNGEYLTADSAYALYYDLGSVAASNGSASCLTYYGIFSHKDVAAGSGMTVDITSPTSLALDSSRTAYIRQSNVGIADFGVQAEMKNYISDTAKDYSSVTLAIHTASGLMPLDPTGAAVNGVTYDNIDPYILSYADVSVGRTVSDTLYFSARPASKAEYRKIRLELYDTSSSPALTSDKLLGQTVFYVLCPGTDGGLPTVTFTEMTPGIIYFTGTRHLFLTGDNIDILYTSLQNGNCTLKAYSKSKIFSQVQTIPKENILQSDTNKLDIILKDLMLVGDWYLQFEWSDAAVQNKIVKAADQKQTAPALAFTVSDDTQYKNDTYGVIAVVQTAKAGAGTTPTYRILSFTGESDFQKYQKGEKQQDGTYLKSYVEILLVFRGEFEIKETSLVNSVYVPALVTATSLKSSADAKAVNSVSINNCMDFENGVLTIKYASAAGGLGDVTVDFDGDLYTSGARTSIWKGEAAFTTLEQGKEYSLISYDKNGERGTKTSDLPVTLVWPSVFGVGQTIAGMVFNLAYGQLGVMKDEKGDELGRVISFSAKLDLGFLIPDKSDIKSENNYWNRLKDYWTVYMEGYGGITTYMNALGHFNDRMLYSNEEQDTDGGAKNEGTASVIVSDILYGCGTGFVGVHFNVNVKLPNYVAGMPKIVATLEVNTIGDWSFGVEGSMEMKAFTLEVSLKIKSHNNIPVPDKIYIFISGFEPGINIDSSGVLWVTGAGGGIDNLYDTIFLTSGVPPLKILLSVSFDILKVLSARADFSISLQGLTFKASEIKLKKTNIVALKKAAFTFNWYPDIYLMASLSMSLVDIINGSGYMVLEGKAYKDWFFEAFVRASVGIPKSIPLVGGIQVGQVDLGVSSVRIWGALKILSISMGLTYYWGGDVNFGSGDIAQPTYPDLLGCDDIPVYYDKENDRTLYMHVGTNLSAAARAEIVDDPGSTPELMGTSYLRSAGDRKTHEFNLGTRVGTDDAILQITYDAAGLTEAQNIAGQIIAGKISSTTGDYAVTLYDGSNLDTANANVTYDNVTGKGSLAVTMTADGDYGKKWSFTTPVAADVILYNVSALPEIESLSGSVTGSDLTVNWTGSELSELDSVKFYLVTDKDDVEEGGYPLGELTAGADIAAGSKTLTVPSDVPSGSYFLRAVYSQDGVLNNVITGNLAISVTNANTPAAPSVYSVSAAGDLKFRVGLASPSADAYVVNIYRQAQDPGTDVWNWEYSDISNFTVDKTDLVNDAFTVGGGYEYDGKPFGLAANTGYRIGITACNYVDSDLDGTVDTAVYSAERYYCAASGGTVAEIGNADTLMLPEPTPPDVTVTADRNATPVQRTVGNRPETFDTYASSNLTLTVSASEAVTGTWALDEGESTSGTLSGGTSSTIALTGLTEGDHTLTVKGVDGGGDGFRKTCSFSVDTLPPKLLLTSPVNGSFFHEDGTLTVSGSTDSDALFTVTCDGVPACAGKSIAQLGGTISSDGTFSFAVPLPDVHSKSSHHVAVSVSDAVGNLTSAGVDVTHGGLADIATIDVYSGGVKWSNGNIKTDAISSRTSRLTLVATTRTGISFILTDENLVSWSCFSVEGTASISDDGLLTMGPGSVGYATGALRVASSGSLAASVTYGAEGYNSRYSVITGSTLGGSATGGGNYAPGETVTLTATPDAGYDFSGWTVEGVSMTDTSSAVISFTMPAGNVVATASFTPHLSGKNASSGNTTAYTVAASAGTKAVFLLPQGAAENRFVPYYIKDGEKVYVPMSAVIGGALTFIAPVDGVYYLGERDVSFSDISGHWAENAIVFGASRGLFSGVGNNLFDPGGTMTRAMFVTVLWRLAGSPDAGADGFSDTQNGQWYSKAVAWAFEKGIMAGYGNGSFGVNDNVTREQMCVIFLRYLKDIGFDTSVVKASPAFSDESSVSAWAKEAVDICRSLGLVNGKGGGVFDPNGLATRAECCAVFSRLIKTYLQSI